MAPLCVCVCVCAGVTREILFPLVYVFLWKEKGCLIKHNVPKVTTAGTMFR